MIGDQAVDVVASEHVAYAVYARFSSSKYTQKTSAKIALIIQVLAECESCPLLISKSDSLIEKIYLKRLPIRCFVYFLI